MPGRAPAPMLAHSDTRLPTGEHWRYEPKLDGFRGLLWRRPSGRCELLSRSGRDLAPWFPELVQAAQQLPPGTLLDGEIVICDETGWAEFGRLQERLSAARKRVAELVARQPAVLIVFDALYLDGRDLTSKSLVTRRAALESGLAHMSHPCVQLVAHTHDLQLARDWLDLPSLEGVVAKRADRPYVSGRSRDWVKVKRHRTVDCAVVGMAGDVFAPRLVLALRHDDGNLHHFGVTRPLAVELTAPLTEILDGAGPELPAIRSRWAHDAIPPWRPLPATLVCEVRVTNLDAGRWARFPAAFVRWRPDRAPQECRLEQLLS